MSKSSQAFRTIREVSDWLGVKAHVLRFWESKFPQIKPVKRAGGRRYYRPGDMELVGGIKVLLHEQGMTIKGVQDMIRTQGTAHVAAQSPPLEALDFDTSTETDIEAWDRELAQEPAPAAVPEIAAEIPEESAAETVHGPEPEPVSEPEPDPVPEPEPIEAAESVDEEEPALPFGDGSDAHEDADAGLEPDPIELAAAPAESPEPEEPAAEIDPIAEDPAPTMAGLMAEFAELTAALPALSPEAQAEALPLIDRAAALARHMAPPAS